VGIDYVTSSGFERRTLLASGRRTGPFASGVWKSFEPGLPRWAGGAREFAVKNISSWQPGSPFRPTFSPRDSARRMCSEKSAGRFLRGKRRASRAALRRFSAFWRSCRDDSSEITIASGDGSQNVFQRVPCLAADGHAVPSTDGGAYWTPEGYYDASVNGHTSSVGSEPRLEYVADFYRADQYSRRSNDRGGMGGGRASEAAESADRREAEKKPVKVHEFRRKIAATPGWRSCAAAGTGIEDGFTRVTARISTPRASSFKAKVLRTGWCNGAQTVQ